MVKGPTASDGRSSAMRLRVVSTISNVPSDVVAKQLRRQGVETVRFRAFGDLHRRKKFGYEVCRLGVQMSALPQLPESLARAAGEQACNGVLAAVVRGQCQVPV